MMDWTGVNPTWFYSLDILQKKKFLSRLSRRVPDHLRPEDKINYGAQGWKKRYYEEKFQFDVNNPQKLKEQVEDTIYRLLVGLQWNLSYYRTGCPSWTWGYPDVYSPALSDIVYVMKNLDMDRIYNSFPSLGAPILPFVQLMCVLPPGTVGKGYALPLPLQELVCDEQSQVSDLFHRIEIINDYEHAFEHWQAVTKVPFPEVERIEEEATKLYSKISAEDNVRNKPLAASLFMFSNNPLAEMIDSSTAAVGVEDQPADVLHDNVIPQNMQCVDTEINGFIRLSEKVDNVLKCVYRPFKYVEKELPPIPPPENILTNKQLSDMRSNRRYGNFDFNIKVHRNRGNGRRPGKRSRKPYRRNNNNWNAPRTESPEFIDNLSSEDDKLSPRDSRELPEGLDFVSTSSDEGDLKRGRSKSNRKRIYKKDPAQVVHRPQHRKQNRESPHKSYSTQNPHQKGSENSKRKDSKQKKKTSEYHHNGLSAQDQDRRDSNQSYRNQNTSNRQQRHRGRGRHGDYPQPAVGGRRRGRRGKKKKPKTVNQHIYGNVYVDEVPNNNGPQSPDALSDSISPPSNGLFTMFETNGSNLYSDLPFQDFDHRNGGPVAVNANMDTGRGHYRNNSRRRNQDSRRRPQYQDPSAFQSSNGSGTYDALYRY